MSSPTVQLLLTGNELMTGDIVDSNSAMIAQELKELGLEIARKVTVADDINLLTSEIKSIVQQADILIINGGLGPTVDDLTSQALAKATATSIKKNTEAYEHLLLWCKNRGVELSAPNLKQAMLPQDCTIIKNRIGSALGFSLVYQNCFIFCTPGVPHELKIMMQEQIKPNIAKLLPDNLISQVTRLQVFGLGESALQKLIDDQLPNWPSSIELGFRAGLPLLEVKLSTNSIEGAQLKDDWQAQLISILGDHYIAEVKGKPYSLAEHVIKDLASNKLKITTAESCTGGLIASMLTGVSGSSECFEAGYVTYSNKMKSMMLNVPENIIENHGAVSQPVVEAMAHGALHNSSADLAIAVSGVAGPNGGSVDKPVGTIWIAWGSIDDIQSECLLLPFTRHYFQQYAANIALDLIRRRLIKSAQVPSYIQERIFKSIIK
jgi:nicotinamide-nucleotide amidase